MSIASTAAHRSASAKSDLDGRHCGQEVEAIVVVVVVAVVAVVVVVVVVVVYTSNVVCSPSGAAAITGSRRLRFKFTDAWLTLALYISSMWLNLGQASSMHTST